MQPAAPKQGLRLHFDIPLATTLALIAAFGLLVLNSAVHGDRAVLVNQLVRVGGAFALMFVLAQVDPRFYMRIAPTIYVVALVLLIGVLIVGARAKGAQRWLDLPGLPRFQPSEIMKLAVPLVIAWYFHDRPLPPSWRDLLVALALIAVPAALIVIQPDLGTAIMVAGGGVGVVFLSGIHWRILASAFALAVLLAPIGWLFMPEYQKSRVLTFLDPERDPLGASWNIIQSKTALGSGGFAGKGLFGGTQSQLEFLPEANTDFIIAVIGEELGLLGATFLLVLYLVAIARALLIAVRAPDTFGRLAAGSLALIFFAYVFVNIAMVSGMLPVVGVPLPLVSYGGTSAITLLIGFGIVMSIHTHRRW